MKLVPPDALSDEWARVHTWIGEAIEHGTGDENETDVLIALARGIYSLWTTEHVAAVMQVIRYPRQTVWLVVYAGGSAGLSAFKDAWDFATVHAKANGIDAVRCYGRPGWQKLLGLKQVGVVLQEVI